MPVNDVWKWYKRMAIVYATGVWTMVGSYAFYKYTGRLEDIPVEKETAVPLPEDKTRLFFFTDHSKVMVVCQKDFVPYTTRIYNFISSFNNPGGDE